MDSVAMDRAGPAPVRFFHKYNRAIGAAYALLLLGLAGFFGWQLTLSMRDEVAFIRGQLDRHAQFLEFVLRSSADQIESLRMVAGAERASGRACQAGHAVVASGELRQAGTGFDRDGLRRRDAGGNVVGQGGLEGRPEEFYCELGAALALDHDDEGPDTEDWDAAVRQFQTRIAETAAAFGATGATDGPRAAQRPCHFGGRFCAKARGPSTASWLSIIRRTAG